MNKRLIIQNLKECFGFGMSFNDLAKVENEFLKLEDFTTEFITDCGTFKFLNAQVLQNGTKVMYYKFIPIF